MQLVRNERRIRLLSVAGRNLPWVGLLILGAGLILSFQGPEWFVPFVISVPVGMILSAVGGYLADHYAGPLAHHQALADALKGLNKDYVLFQYTLPVPHVLLEPGGCTVLVVKSHQGQVSYRDGRWRHRQKGKFFRQIAGEDRLGAPDRQARRQVETLRRWLDKRAPDIQVPVRAAILFVSPDVTLDADASPVPAFLGKKVKKWLRGPGQRSPLSDETYDRLAETLRAA